MKCQACGKDAYMGFTCKRCGGYFCTKDRLPENHNCAFRNMKSEEIQVRMQLENKATPRFERSPSEPSFNERKYYSDKTMPRDYEDEEENNSGRFIAGGPAIDLRFYLLIFVVFAVMDLITFFIYQTPWAVLPIIVHAVFLPFLFYVVYKQRRGDFPPKTIVTFFQLLIAYMIVYLITEIIVAVTMVNYILIGIDVIIGICMVVVWSRALQQLKYLFGRQQ